MGRSALDEANLCCRLKSTASGRMRSNWSLTLVSGYSKLDRMVARAKGLTKRERALQTRARMLDAAFDSFGERGYQGTTMAGVAAAAGVAEQTVYFTFHTKAALLHEVMVAKRNAPEEATAVMDTSWIAAALAEPDQRRTLALTVEHGTEIFRRLAPIATAMTAAALTDRAVASYLETVADERRQGMTRMVAALAAKGPLAVSDTEAVDVIDVLQSMSTYNAFVAGCGWTTEQYKAWCYRALTQLLPPLAPTKARAADLVATRGLSFHEAVTAETDRGQPKRST